MKEWKKILDPLKKIWVHNLFGVLKKNRFKFCWILEVFKFKEDIIKLNFCKTRFLTRGLENSPELLYTKLLIIYS